MKKTLLGLMVLGLVAGASTFAFGPRWASTDWTCPDTNNNGVCDGLEDFDGDGVVNNQDSDYVNPNAASNPYFVDENNNGVCDYRENGTTALGGIGARRGGRWANLSGTTLTTSNVSTVRRGFARWAR